MIHNSVPLPIPPLSSQAASDEGTRSFFHDARTDSQSLVVVEDGQVQVYPLDSQVTWSFGRISETNHPDIGVHSPIVSRKHAQFVRLKDGWHYEAFSTKNSTFINGDRIGQGLDSQVLEDGDIIRIDAADLTQPDLQGIIMLVTVNYNRGKWQSYRLPVKTGTSVFIGRANDQHTIVQDVPYVSRRHARIERTNNGYTIRDMGSRIGTYVNDMPVHKTVLLREKDVIAIGDCRFFYTHGTIVYDQRMPKGTQVQATLPRLHALSQPTVALPQPSISIGLPPKNSASASRKSSVIIDVDVQEKRGTGRDRKKLLLKNVNFSINDNSMVAIIGTSGAGKTLLLNCLSGKDKYFTGQTTLNGTNLQKNINRLGKMIGYVQQSNVFLPPLTVHEELYSSAKLRLPDDYAKQQLEEKVAFVLDVLNLKALRDIPIKRLSGGQKRRVSVARELIGFPSILCLDEPDAGLSYPDKRDLFTYMSRIVHDDATREEFNSTVSSIVMVVHEIDLLDMFDQVIIVAAPQSQNTQVKEPGQLAFVGSPLEAKEYFNHASNYREMFDELECRIKGIDGKSFTPFASRV